MSGAHFSTGWPARRGTFPSRGKWRSSRCRRDSSGTSRRSGRERPAPSFSMTGPARPRANFFWAGDGGQVGQVLHAYKSAWLPASLLKSDQQARLVEALFAAPAIGACRCISTRDWPERPPKKWRRPGTPPRIPPCWMRLLWRLSPAADHRPFPASRAMNLMLPPLANVPREIGKAMDVLAEGCDRAPVPMSRKAISSSIPGSNPSGARITRG